MRAMSLTAEDSEGEQNEMRSLQTQLDLTTQLVHKLSLQLTELKEQVHRQNNTSFNHYRSMHICLACDIIMFILCIFGMEK